MNNEMVREAQEFTNTTTTGGELNNIENQVDVKQESVKTMDTIVEMIKNNIELQIKVQAEAILDELTRRLEEFSQLVADEFSVINNRIDAIENKDEVENVENETGELPEEEVVEDTVEEHFAWNHAVLLKLDEENTIVEEEVEDLDEIIQSRKIGVELNYNEQPIEIHLTENNDVLILSQEEKSEDLMNFCRQTILGIIEFIAENNDEIFANNDVEEEQDQEQLYRPVSPFVIIYKMLNNFLNH